MKQGAKAFLMLLSMAVGVAILIFAFTYKSSDKAATAPKPSVNPVSIETIIADYNENKVRANDKYEGQRHRITAKINGMGDGGGLLNFSKVITLTMEVKIGNKTTFFYADFNQDQKESIKKVNKGDTITFEGTCSSVGNWVDCEIVR